MKAKIKRIIQKNLGFPDMTNDQIAMEVLRYLKPNEKKDEDLLEIFALIDEVLIELADEWNNGK